jgi:kynureninase
VNGAARDAADPLAALRERFALPEGKVYFDGNSLGALPRHVPQVIAGALAEQWGEDLISSWNRHDWIGLPERVGERIAPLVGAAAGQVLCCDSISVNLFKLLAAALALRPGRRVILTRDDDFPTDGYIAQGLASLLGDARCELRRVAAAGLEEALGEDVAVLLLTEVNYRSGERLPMAEVTDRAHSQGALVVWDLAHSAGALPVALDACDVDFAVGCGYKYFNGGPGAPAFLYVNRRHQTHCAQPLSGWLGHREPFAFSGAYRPADGVRRFQAGTPAVLSMLALEAALDVFDGVDLALLRRKSLDLSSYFLDQLQAACLLDTLDCVTPREPERRGSQISLRHPEAWGISQALIDAGVIVDFRAPDIVRFGFAPLYNSFSEVDDACRRLQALMQEQRYRDSRYAQRPAVT